MKIMTDKSQKKIFGYIGKLGWDIQCMWSPDWKWEIRDKHQELLYIPFGVMFGKNHDEEPEVKALFLYFFPILVIVGWWRQE